MCDPKAAYKLMVIIKINKTNKIIFITKTNKNIIESTIKPISVRNPTTESPPKVLRLHLSPNHIKGSILR